MKRYLIDVMRSEESTSFIVEHESAKEAAETYIKWLMSDEGMAYSDGVSDPGERIRVHELPEGTGTPQIFHWEKIPETIFPVTELQNWREVHENGFEAPATARPE